MAPCKHAGEGTSATGYPGRQRWSRVQTQVFLHHWVDKVFRGMAGFYTWLLVACTFTRETALCRFLSASNLAGGSNETTRRGDLSSVIISSHGLSQRLFSHR
ncbi:hypothetical protein DPEC_G00287350 [Dallia pectoralis]|uniref:Uncharacterized protein n=1 Tax=Dallia pectoralis TaxID=75939 RepID=A0ACC2FKF1_DALPE|nr:hypothetical protein DPEC_G00287350 [Dallia pectoralis]